MVETTSRTPQGLVSIVIVTYGQLAYTRECLESIRRNTACAYELIVVDNGSCDGTAEFLKSQADVRLINNPENRGFPAAANQGLHVAGGELVLLLNNDVVVPAGWLERLVGALKSHPELGIVGPCSNHVSGAQEVAVTYQEVSGMDQFAGEFAKRNAGQLQVVERLVGFCMLFRREILARVGFLDERFGIGNFEDDDFCRRAAREGFRAAIVRDAFVHHYGSVTFRGAGMDLGSLLARNRRSYEEKWATSSTPIAVVPALPDVPRLSLCMIVRDGSRTLGACLESIRPWVDEMVVVDTGSKDETMAMARSLGARVFEFPWCDSFAAARNESLRHATGDWIIWMDADDTIDPANGATLRALARRRTAALGYVLQVRCPAVGGAATDTVVDHVKVIRKHADIRFTGRIHEQILPAIRRLGGEVEWTDIWVTHSGSDQSETGRARKQQRDLRLLELELADDPDSSFALFNMGMTLLDARRAGEALVMLARSLQLASPGESHCRKIYALLVQAYSDLGRGATALKTCMQGLEHFPEDVELSFRKGQLQLMLGDCAGAERTTLELIARSEAQAGARYFASFDNGIVGIRAWQMLAAARQRLGNFAGSAEAWRRVISFNWRALEGWIGWIESLAQGGNLAGLERMLDEAEMPVDARILARARALALRGQVAGAVGELEKACEAGASVEVLDELCRLLFTSDQTSAAERWLGEMALRRPEDPAAAFNLAVVLLRRQKYAEAADKARRSLQLRPGHPGAMDVLAKAHAGMARP